MKWWPDPNTNTMLMSHATSQFANIITSFMQHSNSSDSKRSHAIPLDLQLWEKIHPINIPGFGIHFPLFCKNTPGNRCSQIREKPLHQLRNWHTLPHYHGSHDFPSWVLGKNADSFTISRSHGDFIDHHPFRISPNIPRNTSSKHHMKLKDFKLHQIVPLFNRNVVIHEHHWIRQHLHATCYVGNGRSSSPSDINLQSILTKWLHTLKGSNATIRRKDQLPWCDKRHPFFPINCLALKLKAFKVILFSMG